MATVTTTSVKTLHHFDIFLSVKTPFSTASSQPSRFGMDTPLLRNHKNQICIPGTLVQGRLREEIVNWGATFDALSNMLGAKADDVFAPNRKQINFTDFVLQADKNLPAVTPTQIRIKINKNGVVETGQIQVIEQVAKSGETLKFKGAASIWLDAKANDIEVTKMANLLTGALKLIAALGADHSVGFGELADVEVTHRAHSSTEEKWPEGATAVALHLQFDRPFLVSETSVKANVFNGSAIVPGNVLKGAFADTCKLLGEKFDDEVFAKIVFRHAFCARGAARPRALPASLTEFKVEDEKTHIALDLAQHPHAVLLGKDDNLSAPKFSADWKEAPPAPAKKGEAQTDLAAHFGWQETTTSLRVRTAIESETRAAQDESLFAYNQVLHEQQRCEGENGWSPLTWHAVIDLCNLEARERNAYSALIAKVFNHGLIGLGKTKATATVTKIEAHDVAPLAVKEGALVYLTLQTPALLTAQAPTHTTLRDAYEATFAAIGRGALDLSHFYATQMLRGGKYQHTRFSKDKTAPKYAPWLLTEAGAVFALKVVDGKESDANVLLQQWQSKGLPLAPDCNTSWESNPYQPENGFGEIVVNYPEHEKWSPKVQEIKAKEITPTIPSEGAAK